MAKRKRTNTNSNKLRAKFNKGSYKSLDSYLNAVYKNNKDLIDSKIPSGNKTTQSSKTRFKQAVKEYMEEGKRVNQALDSLQRSRIFTSEREHYENNVLKALKSEKELFNKFRKLSGWKEKIDKTKLNYVESDDKSTLYKYDSLNNGIIFIRFSKSPRKGLGASIEVFR